MKSATAIASVVFALAALSIDVFAASAVASAVLQPGELIAQVGVIHPSKGLVFGLGAVLLVVDIRGWRIVSPMLDRERLITGTKS